jgi:hypothetical protein
MATQGAMWTLIPGGATGSTPRCRGTVALIAAWMLRRVTRPPRPIGPVEAIEREP